MSFSIMSLFVVITRFSRVIQSGFHSLLDYRDKPGNDIKNYAGMTNSVEAG